MIVDEHSDDETTRYIMPFAACRNCTDGTAQEGGSVRFVDRNFRIVHIVCDHQECERHHA